jgi:hypothetical protein
MPSRLTPKVGMTIILHDVVRSLGAFWCGDEQTLDVKSGAHALRGSTPTAVLACHANSLPRSAISQLHLVNTPNTYPR